MNKLHIDEKESGVIVKIESKVDIDVENEIIDIDLNTSIEVINTKSIYEEYNSTDGIFIIVIECDEYRFNRDVSMDIYEVQSENMFVCNKVCDLCTALKYDIIKDFKPDCKFIEKYNIINPKVNIKNKDGVRYVVNDIILSAYFLIKKEGE